MKKYTTLSFAFLVICTSILFYACKKDESKENELIQNTNTADLTTKINTSVSGFITDENNAPVQGASVTAGNKTGTTNLYGYFEIKNASIVKNAALVTVIKTGYFTGIKTYTASENKVSFFRIKLIPKNISGSLNAATGGSVTLSSGLIVALPANAVVTASTNTAYTGIVNISSFFIDPLAADIASVMPGDQRGIDNSGALKGLTTFGMAAVELRGAAGEKLQIATGKQATLTFPLSGVVSANAGASIPLWYLDETTGLWKEEGAAIKTGNSYVGQVSHFSYWNCDLPNAIVPLTFTIVDAAGNPANDIHVEITPLTPNSWSHIGGNTGPTGYVSVFVTPNTSYSLTLSINNCSQALTSQNFSVTTSAVALGNITVGNAGNLYMLSGSVTDCNNAPLADGNLFVQNGFGYSSYPIPANGTYNISYFSCNSQNNQPVNFIAQNNATFEQSPVIVRSISPGANNLAPMQACGSTTSEYVQYNFSGITHSFYAPANYIFIDTYPGSSRVTGLAQNDRIYLYFANNGAAVGTAQPINSLSFGASADSLVVNPGSLLNITEYGNVGQYIGGNFAIIAHKYIDPAITYNITCNFRIKRY